MSIKEIIREWLSDLIRKERRGIETSSPLNSEEICESREKVNNSRIYMEMSRINESR